jgi:protease-4
MPSLPGRRPPVLLELDLTELPASPDADDPLARLRARGSHQLAPTLRALHQAAADPKVAGLIAKLGPALPWAAMQELRLGVMAFAAGGKPTVAWAESFGEGAADMAGYVLATAFGEIWLQPGGGLGMLGVGIETTFLRGALDRLGVEPQLEQRYEFKNAADQLMRSEFTEAHRFSLDRISESLYEQAILAIADGRGIVGEKVRELADSGPRTAAEALAVGLVDALGYRDQAYDAIRSQVGAEPDLLFADQWRPRRRRPFSDGLPLPHKRNRNKEYVALVEVRGAIGSGRTRRSPLGRQVGSDSISAALRASAQDDDAKALVLRVDSPGGSAVASDTIWREVCRVRETGKPVVVSMGEAAASGGYYIACAADVIFALPSTITGSIGVFGGKVVVRDLLDRVGLSTGSVFHGARSLMFSSRRGFSAEERERLAVTIDAIYDDFVAKVAQGRRRPLAEIEAIARGRVWTGADALKVGLVDQLGGLAAATALARERAGLPGRAELRAPIQLGPLSRLGKVKNSDDPRAQISLVLPAFSELSEVAAALGVGELVSALRGSARLRVGATKIR